MHLRLRRLAFFLALLPMSGTWASDDAYEDRVISESDIWEDPQEEPERNTSGLPRGFWVEGVASSTSQSFGSRSVKTNESGVLFGGYADSEEYGTFSVEGSLREEGGGSFSVWQQNMQFEGGLRADSGAGYMYSTSVDLIRNQYRFFVPSAQMVGLMTKWTSRDGQVLLGSVGAPAITEGIRVPAINTLPGMLFSFGGQSSIAPGVDAGVMVAGSQGLEPLYGVVPGTSVDTTSSIASVGWKGEQGSLKASGILVNTSLTDTNGGLWFDGHYRGETIDHYGGVFYFQPGLVWANQSMVTNIQGLYYRGTQSSRQLIWDGGFDYTAPVETQTSYPSQTSLFVTGNVRYQYSRDWGVGGSANVLDGPSSGWSGQAYVDYVNSLGISKVQVGYAEMNRRQGKQLYLDQQWKVPEGLRLSTGLVFRRESSQYDFLREVDQYGFTVTGGGNIGNNFSIDGNIQYATGDREVGNASYVNASATWRPSRDLSVSLTAYQNQTRTWQPLIVNSPIANQIKEPIKLDGNGLFLSVRYAMDAGSQSAPMGGLAGEVGGRVSGIVFYDNNADGRQNAGEFGIPNLTIRVNGRFIVRTDGTGMFSIPSIRAGDNAIEIMPDNLPLPWHLENDGVNTFQVRIRETTHLEIGAIKR